MATIGNGFIFDQIYRNEDYEAYIPAMMEGKAQNDPSNPFVYDTNGNARTEKQRRAYYRNHWRRRQMSDHLAMWLELKIDYGEEYLKKRRPDS